MSQREPETVGLLYDAAVGNVTWSDFGRHLTALVDGATLTITAQYGPAAAVEIVDMHGIAPKAIELYATHFMDDDLWRNEVIGRHIFDQVILGTDVVSDLRWRNSRIYTDLLRSHADVFHCVAVQISLPERGSVALGIHRPRMAKPFGASATEKIAKLLPHLRRAFLIRARLGAATSRANLSASALDRLSFGIVQLTVRGKVASFNRAADELLSVNDGLSLTHSGLRAALPRDNSRLQAAIGQAAAPHATDRVDARGYLRIARPSGRKPYVVLVAPIGQSTVFLSSHQPAVMLIITDPESGPRLDERAMTRVFGFTPAEARLVGLLVTGMPLPDIAAALGISFETARTHLARARAKTETRSQVDLVQAALMALAPLRAPIS